MKEKIVFDFLRDNNIKYQLFKHQPVFKAEDKPILIDSSGVDTIPGLQSKNLFLKDSKIGLFFLVSVAEDKRVDLKALTDVLGCGRLSFAKPEELMGLLKLEPGAVTPFGLMFDEKNKVLFVLDQDFLDAICVIFHPLRNDMNVTLSPKDFLTCMEKINHSPRIVSIPVKVR
jgi:Ala-tRNA(Pro) deacylase